MVIDVGAGLGLYTLPSLAMGAIVHAFEPDVAQAELLAESVRLNRWGARGFIWQIGLHRGNGEADLHVGFAPRLRVPVRSLDSWWGEYGPSTLQWMKIDVEGEELNVLRGASATISQFHPTLVVENHQFMDSALESQAIELVRGWVPEYQTESVPYLSVTHTRFWIPT